jgi:hypothetical protein
MENVQPIFENESVFPAKGTCAVERRACFRRRSDVNTTCCTAHWLLVRVFEGAAAMMAGKERQKRTVDLIWEFRKVKKNLKSEVLNYLF